MENKKETVSKKTETKNKGLQTQIPDLLTFLKAGAHFGHKKSAWNPKMDKYIYEQRNGVHIIDLVKSQKLLEQALLAIEDSSSKGYVLMVGTKGQAATIVQDKSEEVGAFYINNRWPGGLFTNFEGLRKGVVKLVKMEEEVASGGQGLVKKEVLMMQRDIERNNRIYEGVKFMDRLPSMIIVIDSKVEQNAIKEANIAGIPIVGLIDTNCDPDVITYPIPANDDSLKSIKLYVDLFAQAISHGKKSSGLIDLRKNHKAKLEALNSRYVQEKERVEKMEEDERLRMKALREGKQATVNTTGVVRVVKKEKNIEEDIKAAEEAKEQSNAVSIEDLGLPTRTVKALMEDGITTVKGLSGKSKSQLMEIKGVGDKAADDILKALK